MNVVASILNGMICLVFGHVPEHRFRIQRIAGSLLGHVITECARCGDEL